MSRSASRPLTDPGPPMLSLVPDLPNLCSLAALLAAVFLRWTLVLPPFCNPNARLWMVQESPARVSL